MCLIGAKVMESHF